MDKINRYIWSWILVMATVGGVWMVVPMPNGAPPFSATRYGSAATAALTAGLVYAGYLAYKLVGQSFSIGRRIDGWFEEMGFTAEPFGLKGRQYTGEWQGRDVTVTLQPDGRQAPRLNLYVTVAGGHRLAVGQGRPLKDCGECDRINPPGLEELDMRAEDAAWAVEWVAQPAVADAIRQIVTGGYRAPTDLYIQPERIWVRVAWKQPEQTEIRLWLDNAAVLADHLELTDDRGA